MYQWEGTSSLEDNSTLGRSTTDATRQWSPDNLVIGGDRTLQFTPPSLWIVHWAENGDHVILPRLVTDDEKALLEMLSEKIDIPVKFQFLRVESR
jgi:hypothetical protein